MNDQQKGSSMKGVLRLGEKINVDDVEFSVSVASEGYLVVTGSFEADLLDRSYPSMDARQRFVNGTLGDLTVDWRGLPIRFPNVRFDGFDADGWRWKFTALSDDESSDPIEGFCDEALTPRVAAAAA